MTELINQQEKPKQKFIQVYVYDKPYLRFVRHDYELGLFHLLINEFCFKAVTVEFGENHLIEKEGENYKFVGAGEAQNIMPGKTILSGTYPGRGLEPDRRHAFELSKLTGLEFIVED